MENGEDTPCVENGRRAYRMEHQLIISIPSILHVENGRPGSASISIPEWRPTAAERWCGGK
jgi:hypothetical protein